MRSAMVWHTGCPLSWGASTTPEGDIIHATGCEWTLAEDVLHVLLSYDHFVRVPLEQENMETLKINEEG